MTKKIIILAVATMLFITLLPSPGAAGGAGILLKGIREAGEFVSRKLGREVLEEGGETLSRKAIRKLARYGAHGRKAFSLVGDDALKVASRYGHEGVKMLASHSKLTARFLARHADDAFPIWKKFGRQGTEFMAKHPGIAKPLLKNCGQRGLILSRKLSPKNLIRLTHFSKKVSRENLETIITWSLAQGDKVMDFLWRHKGKIVAGMTVHSLLKQYDKGFINIMYDKDGNPIATQTSHNLIGYVINTLTTQITQTLPWFFPALGTVALLIIFSLLSGFKKPLYYLWKICVRLSGYTRKAIVAISRFIAAKRGLERG